MTNDRLSDLELDPKQKENVVVGIDESENFDIDVVVMGPNRMMKTWVVKYEDVVDDVEETSKDFD